MKWPWNRARQIERDAEQAERDLQATRDQWPQVHEVSATARVYGARNHFGENIQTVFAGRKS